MQTLKESNNFNMNRAWNRALSYLSEHLKKFFKALVQKPSSFLTDHFFIFYSNI